jgi:hypothetical protein
MIAPRWHGVLSRARGADSCPPCSVCEDVNAVATLSTSLPLLPEFSGKVEEQLRLRRDVAEPGRRPKGDAVGPLDVLEPRIRLMLDLGAVPARVLLRGEEQLLVQLRDGLLGRLSDESLGDVRDRVPRDQERRSSCLVRRANRSDDVVGVVEQVTTRVVMAIGACDFAITQRDRRDLIGPPPSTEL